MTQENFPEAFLISTTSSPGIKARHSGLILPLTGVIWYCPACAVKPAVIYKDRQKIPASGIIDPHNDDPRTFFTFVIEDNRYLSAQPIAKLDSQRFKKAENTIEALKLNFQKLRVARHSALLVYKEAIDTLAGEFQHSVSDEFDILRQLARDLMDSLESEPFSSALVAYATAELKDFIEV